MSIYGAPTTKAQAFVRLTREFDAGFVWTPAMMARHFQVSKRTAERWLTELTPIIPLAVEGAEGFTHQRRWRKS